MKLISIRRKTKREPRYHRKMGRIVVPVTRIQKTFLGIPFKTIKKYRETYHGTVKETKNINLSYVK